MNETNIAPFNIVTDGTNVTEQVVAPVTSLVNQLLEVSPPVGLALVLAIVCALVVSLTKVNKLIVDLVAVVGAAALYPQVADPGKVGFSVHNPVAAQIITGALIGCAAVIVTPFMTKLLTKIGVLAAPAAGAVLLLASTGCTSTTATSVTATGTNTFRSTTFLARNKLDQLDVAHSTKTTTKLIGAKNVEVSGDAQMVSALADFMGAAMAAGAKAAVKP